MGTSQMTDTIVWGVKELYIDDDPIVKEWSVYEYKIIIAKNSFKRLPASSKDNSRLVW